MGPGNHVLDGARISETKWAILGVVHPTESLCCDICKNGQTDQDAQWCAKSCGPKKACT